MPNSCLSVISAHKDFGHFYGKFTIPGFLASSNLTMANNSFTGNMVLFDKYFCNDMPSDILARIRE